MFVNKTWSDLEERAKTDALAHAVIWAYRNGRGTREDCLLSALVIALDELLAAGVGIENASTE